MAALGLAPLTVRFARAQPVTPPGASTPAAFIARAFEMRRISIERGDQAYGAVLVLDGRIVGDGISAVITARDPSAHAERQAMRDASSRLGRETLEGSVLYSTSRPCIVCESAAARARVARMFHGEAILDAGVPRERL